MVGVRSWRAVVFVVPLVAVVGLPVASGAASSATGSAVNLQLAVQVGSGAGAPMAAGFIVVAAGAKTVCAAACDVPTVAGASVTVTVKPVAGYAFDNWGSLGICASPTAPSCTFSMPSSDFQLVAVVQPQTSALTVVPGSAGTITAADGSIQCTRTAAGDITGSCSAQYPTPTTVALTVTPAAGKRFVSWSIWQCGRRPVCDVPLTADTTVTALIDPVRLIVERVGMGGNITSSPSVVQCLDPCQSQGANVKLGTMVTLTATPTTGAPFAQWGYPCAGAAPTCALKIFTDTSVSGAFGTSAAPTSRVSPAPAAVAPRGCGGDGGGNPFRVTVGAGGRVYFSSPGRCRLLRCPSTCHSDGYSYVGEVDLQATPYRGYRFLRWTSGCYPARMRKCAIYVQQSSWPRASFARRR